MELILWRHAEAEIGEPDAARALTLKGRQQASKMAGWLGANLPPGCRILVSPATRALQTAEALGRPFEVTDEVGLASDVERVLGAANWPDGGDPVLVIGHQPTLGQIAARLISGKHGYWSVRKANVWWIVRRAHGAAFDGDRRAEHYLRAVVAPELVGK